MLTRAQCSQCDTITSELQEAEDYGFLCSRCAFRQEERSGHGYGLAASTFGFLSETE